MAEVWQPLGEGKTGVCTPSQLLRQGGGQRRQEEMGRHTGKKLLNNITVND